MIGTALNQTDDKILLEKIKESIILELGGDPEKPFTWIYREPVEVVLDLRPGSLAALHSGNKITLPFYKSGRRARYRLEDVAQYLLSRRHVSMPPAQDNEAVA